MNWVWRNRLNHHLGIATGYIDREGIVRHANAALAEILNSDGPGITGQPIRRLLAAPAGRQIELALAGEPSSFALDEACLRLVMLPHRSEDGSVEGFHLIVEDIADHLRADERLRESEATLRAVFNSASQGLVAVGEGGAILFANPMAESMFGYAAGELPGLQVEALIPARFGDRHLQHRRGYFASPHPRAMGQGLELAARRKDGTEFPVEVSLSHVQTADRQLAIAFLTDVTHRRQLEEERTQFFNLSADLSCVVGADGFFKQVNDSFTQILGWSREEMTSRPFADFLHPDDRRASLAQLQGLGEGRQVLAFTNRYRCQDGTYRWISWQSNSSRPGDTLFYAAGRDVTAARLAEAERERLVALIENSGDLIGLVSPDGRIVYLNKAGCEMAGLDSLEHARRHSLAEVLDLGQALAALESSGRGRGEGAIRHRRTGETVPLDINAFAVGQGDEQTRALVAHDVRRRKRDQERLQALTAQLMNAQEEERRRIARDLHDDITQKLAMLGIEFGLIQREVSGANRTAESHLSGMHEQILRISEDVRQLSHQLHPSVLEHSGLATALEVFGREMGKQTGIAVSVAARNIPASIPRPVATGLYRIAQEAMRNIAKHAHATTAAITLSFEDGLLRLTIIDDGAGFDAAEQESNPGIGMVSMRERVRLMDGRLLIDSEPGEGTRVEVQVPLAAPMLPS